MKGCAKELSVKFMAILSSNTWKMLEKEVSERHTLWSSIVDVQVKVIVKNTRAREYMTDMFVKLETSDVSKMKDSDRHF